MNYDLVAETRRRIALLNYCLLKVYTVMGNAMNRVFFEAPPFRPVSRTSPFCGDASSVYINVSQIGGGRDAMLEGPRMSLGKQKYIEQF